MSVAAEHNKLLSTVLAYRNSKPLLVALDYDLFTWIEKGHRTPAALAKRLKLDARALGILLDAVAELGFLHKIGPAFHNTSSGKKLLVSTSPEYRGSNLKYQEKTWEAWSDLKWVIKSGRPSRDLLGWIHHSAFAEDYVRAMGDVAREPAGDLAALLDLSGVEKSLDIGCGPGYYSAALVERKPSLEAHLLDLPRTLNVTKGLLSKTKHSKRFRYEPADFLKDPFGKNDFDLAIISNVTHCESAANNRKLVSKAFAALRPGGRLVIHDYVKNRELTSPRFAAMLAVHLLVFTGRGNVYTLEEYESWLRKAGFVGIEHRRVGLGSVYPSLAIIGRKP